MALPPPQRRQQGPRSKGQTDSRHIEELSIDMYMEMCKIEKLFFTII